MMDKGFNACDAKSVFPWAPISLAAATSEQISNKFIVHKLALRK
jgi:hypothetical protein